MTDSAGIRPARPTINIAGQDHASLSDGLLALAVIEDANGLYRCEALFGNWGTRNNTTDFLYFDRRTLDFGKPLKVRLGAQASSQIFDGRIMALEAVFPNAEAPAIRALAEDRLQDLRMTRRTRTFDNMSDADVMSQIANEHGLRPQVDVTGPTHKVLAQVNQSDLAFLRERARALDAELWVDGSTLIAKGHTARAAATVRLEYGTQLREFTVLADLAGQRTSVKTNGWDVSGKQAISYEATDAAIRSELGNDVSGVSILAEKIGTRKESLSHSAPLTSAEAQAEAEAFFKRSARRFVLGHGVADPDPQLRVGNRVDLLKLGPLFSGKYTLAEVRHLFDGRGMRTEFVAERAGVGQP
jgi:phage protein D